VHGQQILIVNPADPAIPSGAASHRAEAVYALKKFFQHEGVVIEVTTVSAALPICLFLCTEKYAGKHFHCLTLSDNFPGINNKQQGGIPRGTGGVETALGLRAIPS